MPADVPTLDVNQYLIVLLIVQSQAEPALSISLVSTSIASSFGIACLAAFDNSWTLDSGASSHMVRLFLLVE